MNGVQVQSERSINTKLDRIANLLEELIKIQEDELYPSEDKIRLKTLKRLERMAREISGGKRNAVRFSSIQELDKIVSGMQ